MNKNVTIGVIGVIAVVGLLFQIFGGKATPPSPGTQLSPQDVRAIASEVVKEKPFGAITSPEIANPYLCVNGVCHWYSRVSINNSSTTICSLPSPVATSTLIYASATISTGTTTAIDLDIGRSTGSAATTTVLNDFVIAASGVGTFRLGSTTVASGVVGTGDDFLVFPAWVATSTDASGNPNPDYQKKQFLNFKIGTPTGSNNTLIGNCQAEWISNQNL